MSTYATSFLVALGAFLVSAIGVLVTGTLDRRWGYDTCLKPLCLMFAILAGTAAMGMLIGVLMSVSWLALSVVELVMQWL